MKRKNIIINAAKIPQKILKWKLVEYKIKSQKNIFLTKIKILQLNIRFIINYFELCNFIKIY